MKSFTIMSKPSQPVKSKHEHRAGIFHVLRNKEESEIISRYGGRHKVIKMR